MYRCLFIKYILQTPQFNLIFISCHVEYVARACSVYNVSHPSVPYLSIHHTEALCVTFQRNFKIFPNIQTNIIILSNAVDCKF